MWILLYIRALTYETCIICESKLFKRDNDANQHSIKRRFLKGWS